MRWLRPKAECYKVDPDCIGGSVWGQLAALLGISYRVKELGGSPDFSSRIYPLVSVSGASIDGYRQNDLASEPSLLFCGMVHDKAELVRLADSI